MQLRPFYPRRQSAIAEPFYRPILVCLNDLKSHRNGQEQSPAIYIHYPVSGRRQASCGRCGAFADIGIAYRGLSDRHVAARSEIRLRKARTCNLWRDTAYRIAAACNSDGDLFNVPIISTAIGIQRPRTSTTRKHSSEYAIRG